VLDHFEAFKIRQLKTILKTKDEKSLRLSYLNTFKAKMEFALFIERVKISS